MPVAVIDIGTNTTRLLVAEPEDGDVVELERRTTITTLGKGVDSTGRLADEAMDRVAEAIAAYREVIDRLGAEPVVAVATSAMRDAENGPAFHDYLKEKYGVDARTISGDEEARLTFLGATAGRNDDRETVVIDIGGGSTEYVVGRAGRGAELPHLHSDGLRAVHRAVPERATRPARTSCRTWPTRSGGWSPTSRPSTPSPSPARRPRSPPSTAPRRCTATG